MKKLLFLAIGLFSFAIMSFAGDSCPGSVILRHTSTDGYSPETDYSGTTNAAFYYDYKRPGTSLVDSTQAGCQSFTPDIFASQAGCCIFLSAADWFNNNTCPTLIGCDGRDDDGTTDASDRNVLAVGATTTAATYASRFLVDTVAFSTSLVRYEYDNSVGTLHTSFAMTRPSIQSATCNGSTCNLVVAVTQPNFDATGATGGIYGDTAGVAGGATQSILAGYKIVAVQQAAAPTNGLASNYSLAIADSDRFIPATRPPNGTNVISGTITISGLVGTNPVWLAYVPVFNFAGSTCAAGVACTSAQVAALDAIGTIPNINSLAFRIASPASQPVGPNPVKFVSFNGNWKASKITLTWVTASESDTAGFNLYRMILDDGSNDPPDNSNNRPARNATSDWVKVNAAVIPSLSQAGSGATYTYIDKVTEGIQVKYLLKEVPLSNSPPDSIETTVSKKKSK